MIKLVRKNIRSSINEHRRIYILMIISHFLAVTCILLSYGIFTSYSSKMEEVDEESYLIDVEIRDEKLGNLKSILPEILDKIEKNMEYTTVFARDEDTYVCLYFDYYEGDYQLSEYISDVCIVRNGRKITDEDISNGRNVLYSNIAEDRVGDIYVIGGVTYEVIGVDKVAMPILEIPITASNDDLIVRGMIIEFIELPTKEEYLTIKDTLEKVFGDKLIIEDFNMKDNEVLISYRSIMTVSVMVGVVAALNTSLLFGYIISQRRKQMAVFGVVGATKKMRLIINITEVMLVTILTEVIAVLFFKGFIEDVVMNIYENSVSIYDDLIYFSVPMIYAVCIFAVTCIVLSTMNRKSLVDMIRITKK